MDACGTNGKGWYYDDPDAPKTINLCPSSCEQVQNDPNAKLEIVLGCDTVVL